MSESPSFSDSELFAPPPSFMNAPLGLPGPGCRAAYLGVPFDCGTNALRIGSRHGPKAVREMSLLLRRYNPTDADFDPIAALGLVDCGDLQLVPSHIPEAFARIEAGALRVMRDGAIPITMGGDGAISVPLMRAAARHHKDLVLLHIDSHTDCKPWALPHKYDSGSQFTHGAEEGCIDASGSWHVGIRGTIHAPGRLAHAEGLGFKVVTTEQLLARGLEATVEDFAAQAGGRPVYLSWDMDVFDPSCAPGVISPNWGGLTAREGIALMRALARLNVVFVDIGTVSPPQDVQGMAAHLAAAMAYEAAVMLCRRLGLDAVTSP